MLTDDVEAFEIYRPPRIPSRLEPKFIPPPENEWRPSLDYKHTLFDVKQQFTPAEYYRQRLKTSGAYIRMIQRLEMRWSRHLEKFTSASITVQAWFRGVMGRRLFQKVKIANYDTMLRRKFTPPAMSAYAQGDYHSALMEIFKAPAPHGDVLWTLTAKCQYRLKKYHDCIATCLVLREAHPQNADSYLLHICALKQIHRQHLEATNESHNSSQNHPNKTPENAKHCKVLEEAFELSRDALLRVGNAPPDLYRVNAGLALQQHPPAVDVAIDAYSELVRLNPRDFDSFLARASCNSALQEWSTALQDLQQILAFLPMHRSALLLRARIYTCIRQWALAERDLQQILTFEPTHPQALEMKSQIKAFDPDAVLHIEH